MRRKLLPLILGGALSIAAVAPAAAQTECNLGLGPQGGGAAALVSLVQAVVNANVGVQACDIDIDVLNNSLNNLLRNANVNVLSNILNNNNILNNSLNDVTVTVVGDDLIINVLGGPVITIG